MPESVWVVHVGFVRHAADVAATVDLGVSLPTVESRLSKADWTQRGNATVGAVPGNLVDRRPHRWDVRSEEDASRTAAEAASEVIKFGLDWLQRFSNLETVYDALVPNDQQSWIIMPLHLKRCLILVALAASLHGRDEANARRLECRSFLAARNDPMLGDFDRYGAALVEM